MLRLRLAALVLTVVLVDQLTKLAITSSLAIGESIEVVEGVLRISHVRNTGAAFGLLRGWSGVLALAAVVGVVLLVGIIVRKPPAMTGVGAALIAGGALGNLVDRIVRGPFLAGSVVDFVDFRYWPAFNAADTAIAVGAMVLILAGFVEREDAGGHRADTGADGVAPDHRG